MCEMAAILAVLLDRMEWRTLNPERVAVRSQLVLAPTVPLDIGFTPVPAVAA